MEYSLLLRHTSISPLYSFPFGSVNSFIVNSRVFPGQLLFPLLVKPSFLLIHINNTTTTKTTTNNVVSSIFIDLALVETDFIKSLLFIKHIIDTKIISNNKLFILYYTIYYFLKNL